MQKHVRATYRTEETPEGRAESGDQAVADKQGKLSGRTCRSAVRLRRRVGAGPGGGGDIGAGGRSVPLPA